MTDISAYLKQQQVSCHCFSPDGQFVAVALKLSNTIEIFKYGELHNLATWVPVWKIKEQSMQISSIDWTKNNKILSGSYDRSIYVFRLINNTKWEKDLVLCLNDKAVLCGQWTPNGQKFAIGTSCHRCFVGYYEDKNNWWQSEKISGFKSSVISVSWHPSGRVLGIGSSDNSLSLISAVIQDTNSCTSDLEDGTYSGIYSSIKSFGEVLFQLKTLDGWVESISFTSSGNRLACAVHTGLLQYFDLVQDGDVVKVQFEGDHRQFYPPTLPFISILFKSEDILIAAGHDKKPAIFQIEPKGWVYKGLLEKNMLSDQLQLGKSGAKSAIAAFEKKGATKQSETDKTAHLTAIVNLKKSPHKDFTVCTNDSNGIINFWKV